MKTPANVLWRPHPGKQTFALQRGDIRELLYGGARGGGKTQVGIAWLLKPPHINHPKYRALIIRRNADDLSDWVDRARTMYAGTGAVFQGGRSVREIIFPHSGATLRLGHLKDDNAFGKYQGHEYQKMLVEELTQIPTELNYLKLLSSCRSMIKNVDPMIFCTANPGGPGHEWVKNRWGMGKRGRCKPCLAYRIPKDARLRMYIPATIDDNPTIAKEDPAYIDFLEALPEPIRSAWRYGDWDIFAGQMFSFNEIDHVIDPIPVPDTAPLIMSYDYGFGRPYSIGYWWVDEDNRLYRFAEIYGCIPNQPDVGLRQTDAEVAEIIVETEKTLGIWGRPMLRVCDPTCFNKKPDYRGGGQADATSVVFAQHKIKLTPGDPSRITKTRQFHGRLRVKRNKSGDRLEMPMMVVYSTCAAFIRTIPILQSDPNNPEYVLKTMEDHCFAGETEVMTDCGSKPIESLKGSNGTAIGINGTPVNYLNCRRTRINAPLVRLSFSDGTVVRCTPDHLFMTINGIWKKAVDMYDEECLTCKLWNQNESVRPSKPSTESDTTCVARTSRSKAPVSTSWCGNTIMDRFRNAWQSITSTGIGQTILRSICNLYRYTTTPLNTPRSEITQTGSSRCTQAHDGGTCRPLEIIGTRNTTKNTAEKLLNQRSLRESAPDVERTSQENRGLNFVVEPAVNAILQTGCASADGAQCVTISSRRASTDQRVVVQRAAPGVTVVSIEPAGNADVYCLSVDDPSKAFALANGVIVHNCFEEAALACQAHAIGGIAAAQGKDNWGV